MATNAACSPFESHPGMTGSGRTSPYDTEPGRSIVMAVNGRLPVELGNTPGAYIKTLLKGV